jgi:hypothetical protein
METIFPDREVAEKFGIRLDFELAKAAAEIDSDGRRLGAIQGFMKILPTLFTHDELFNIIQLINCSIVI